MPGPFRAGHIESYNRTVETLCRDCDSRPPPDVKTCPVSAGSTGAGWMKDYSRMMHRFSSRRGPGPAWQIGASDGEPVDLVTD